MLFKSDTPTTHRVWFVLAGTYTFKALLELRRGIPAEFAWAVGFWLQCFRSSLASTPEKVQRGVADHEGNVLGRHRTCGNCHLSSFFSLTERSRTNRSTRAAIACFSSCFISTVAAIARPRELRRSASNARSVTIEI